jgi:hypothetical protein
VQASVRNARRANCGSGNEKGIEGEAFDNAKLCSGAADRRWCGENIITRYQMTVRVEALYSRNPLFADSRRRLTAASANFQMGLSWEHLLSLIVATELRMIKHLRV